MPQRAHPGLAPQRHAERLVHRRLDQHEAVARIQAPCILEHGMGPERDAIEACRTGEGDAGIDEPRADAGEGIAALKRMGLNAVMLTGDNERTGRAIAEKLGLDVRAQLLPEDKLREIARLREAGPVVMVGDGINDAPALAAASVGVAMGGGTDVALETADAALLRERVAGVAELVGLSRATLANIKQNVGAALGLKAIFLVTTLAGLTGLWPAILADTGATVLVTMNALRLLRWGPATLRSE